MFEDDPHDPCLWETQAGGTAPVYSTPPEIDSGEGRMNQPSATGVRKTQPSIFPVSLETKPIEYSSFDTEGSVGGPVDLYKALIDAGRRAEADAMSFTAFPPAGNSLVSAMPAAA